MYSGWWVCIGSRDSVQLQLLRVENNIKPKKTLKMWVADRAVAIYIYIYMHML